MRLDSARPPPVPHRRAAAPIRNAPVTAQTLDVVTSACATAEGALLPACQQCEAAGWNTMDADCPQPLELMGELCRGNPTLPQCASFRALCTEAGATFGSLCGGGGPSSGSGETPRAGATAVPPGSDGSGSGSSSDPALDKTWLHASMTGALLWRQTLCCGAPVGRFGASATRT